MSFNIPFIKPNFPEAGDIASDYTQILKSNWFTNFGPFERQFAKEIGSYVGPEYYATTFSSATAGLTASVLAVIGFGDGSKQILMPSFTFAAGADVLLLCGYKPLFVDIEPNGMHMDLDATKKVLDDETQRSNIVGILFCNAFGVGATNIEAWEALSHEARLPLIIDSAAGFGSLYKQDVKVGTAGVCEVFSFHATKPFAIGEGGAVVSRSKELIDLMNSIQNFGFDNKRNATQLGLNGKLQELNAAIGLRQLKTFPSVLESRKSVFNMYQDQLDSDKFQLQANAENASLCFASVIVKDSRKRDSYLDALKKSGIDAKTYYSPSLHKQDYFKQFTSMTNLEVTELVDNSVISLPIHDSMESSDINHIINTLNTHKPILGA
jgi:dTDP-4-amino-4,6-dideoxygalactose transaminase